MKRAVKRVLILGLFVIPLSLIASIPGDSIGVRIMNGKTYVLYKIAKGDNLGRISKEYGVSVATIEELNSIQDKPIQAGQVLMVPSRGAVAGLSLRNMSDPKPVAPTISTPTPKPVIQVASSSAPKPQAATQNPNPSGNRKQHTVQKGETLYAVSKKYGVTVDEIKSWNQLNADGLKEGQKLWVGSMQASLEPKKIEEPIKVVENPKTFVAEVKPVEPKAIDPKGAESGTSKPVEQIKSVEQVAGGGDQVATKVKSTAGVHVVKPGETLFGIARTYGMDVGELRKINRLENATIKEGQALRVKADSPENVNQGTGLADAIATVTDTATTKLEAFPDLKVLTAPKTTIVPQTAEVTVYKDKSTGATFKRVEETGKAGPIQDFATDQTRFYAFHRYLPTGSYIRVDYPQKGQSILVEVINQLPDKDPFTVRLSAKCLEYLMIRETNAEVRLRYVIPFAE